MAALDANRSPGAPAGLPQKPKSQCCRLLAVVNRCCVAPAGLSRMSVEVAAFAANRSPWAPASTCPQCRNSGNQGWGEVPCRCAFKESNASRALVRWHTCWHDTCHTSVQILPCRSLACSYPTVERRIDEAGSVAHSTHSTQSSAPATLTKRTHPPAPAPAAPETRDGAPQARCSSPAPAPGRTTGLQQRRQQHGGILSQDFQQTCREESQARASRPQGANPWLMCPPAPSLPR